MKKSYVIFLVCFLFVSEVAISQHLSPTVISTSGGFYSNGSGMLSFTTGEMTAVETYASASTILTQGFQQPWDFGTYVTEHPQKDFSFGIYPNPGDGDFNLLTVSDINQHITVLISDLLGRQILLKEFYHQQKTNIQPFDLTGIVQGMYLVSITAKENNSSPAYQYVQKIQIVK